MTTHAYAPNGAKIAGWIGVDLDGTLAEYHQWGGIDEIGPPVPLMLNRVKAWLAQGHEVRIMTARCAVPDPAKQARFRMALAAWCAEHVGQLLEATHQKDLAMRELWDDRAVTVEANTGRVICHPAGEWTP